MQLIVALASGTHSASSSIAAAVLVAVAVTVVLPLAVVFCAEGIAKGSRPHISSFPAAVGGSQWTSDTVVS